MTRWCARRRRGSFGDGSSHPRKLRLSRRLAQRSITDVSAQPGLGGLTFVATQWQTYREALPVFRCGMYPVSSRLQCVLLARRGNGYCLLIDIHGQPHWCFWVGTDAKSNRHYFRAFPSGSFVRYFASHSGYYSRSGHGATAWCKTIDRFLEKQDRVFLFAV